MPYRKPPATELERLFETLNLISEQTHDCVDRIREINEKVSSMEGKLESLTRDIRETGTEPLPFQLVRISEIVKRLQDNMMELTQRIEKAQSQRWQIWLAVLSSLILPIAVGILNYIVMSSLVKKP